MKFKETAWQLPKEADSGAELWSENSYVEFYN